MKRIALPKLPEASERKVLPQRSLHYLRDSVDLMLQISANPTDPT